MRASLARRIILATGALVALPIASSAQQSAQRAATDKPSATFSVDSRLVNIPVVVRDDKGKLILNLKKDDFSLQVDGHPQTIRYFDLDTDLPLTLGLLVDTSGSVRNVLDEERTASSDFLDQMLASKEDKAFVIQFSRSVELLQDVTGSRPKLQAALKQIDTQPPDRAGANNPDNNPGNNNPNSNSRNGNPRGGNRGRMGFRGGTTLYDAVFLASDEVMSKQKGRKALVLLTDGVDRGSKESLASAIEAAQRSDSIVYAIYFKGEQPGGGYGDRRGGGGGGGRRGGIGFPGGGGGYPGGGGGYPGGRGGSGRGSRPEQQVDGKKILERITQETGGRMFEVSKKETVASIYDQIGQELRSQYRLGFTPEADTAAEGYHKIDLALTSKDKRKFTLQNREGYYTGK
jgi:VWFA-related protein